MLVASTLRDYRKYWRAQLVALALIAAGLALGAWVVLRLRFAHSFGEAVAAAGAYAAVKLAVQELTLHLPNIHKVGGSRRAAVGRWFKDFAVAILPDALAATVGLYFGSWGGLGLGLYLAYLLSRFVYVVFYDANSFDSKAAGMFNVVLGALLMAAWWYVGTRYLAG